MSTQCLLCCTCLMTFVFTVAVPQALHTSCYKLHGKAHVFFSGSQALVTGLGQTGYHTCAEIKARLGVLCVGLKILIWKILAVQKKTYTNHLVLFIPKD